MDIDIRRANEQKNPLNKFVYYSSSFNANIFQIIKPEKLMVILYKL